MIEKDQGLYESVSRDNPFLNPEVLLQADVEQRMGFKLTDSRRGDEYGPFDIPETVQ